MKNCKILAIFIITTFLINYLAVPILAIEEIKEEETTTEQEIKTEDIKESDKDNTNTIQKNKQQKVEENNNEIDTSEIAQSEKEVINSEELDEKQLVEQEDSKTHQNSKIVENKSLNIENFMTENVKSSTNVKSQGEPYLEETEVNLYVVNTKLLKEFPEIAIPSSYNTEYKIEVKGTETPVSQMSFYIKDLNR